jgi:hypothetical protein
MEKIIATGKGIFGLGQKQKQQEWYQQQQQCHSHCIFYKHLQDNDGHTLLLL